MTTYTWASSNEGWSGKLGDCATTATRSAGAICSTTGYWSAVGCNPFGNYIASTVIGTDAAISYDTMSISIEVVAIEFAEDQVNAYQIRAADLVTGPWGIGTVIDAIGFTTNGCQTYVSTTAVSNKFIRIYLAGFGDTVTPNAANIYEVTTATAPNARFYHGAGTLTEKFTLPFTGVAPHAMTLDAALGTVVIGGDAPSGVPIIYSQSPYPTGTATFTAFPTGTAITGLDWI